MSIRDTLDRIIPILEAANTEYIGRWAEEIGVADLWCELGVGA